MDKERQDEERKGIGEGGVGEEEVGGETTAKERQEKREQDLAVFNLGVKGMTEDMEEVLSLGLKFVPVQKVNKSKVETDVERLKVRLMWDAYWKWVNELKT